MELSQPNTIPQKYKWDFTFIFKTTKDWENGLKECYAIGQQLVKQGQKLIDGHEFYVFKKTEAILNQKLLRLAVYLNLVNLDLTNAQLVSMQQTFMAYCQKLSTDLAFVDPKIKKIGRATVMQWIKKAPPLHVYQYPYDLFFKQTKHILAPKMERLMAQLGRSRQFCGEIYEKLVYADKKPTFVRYQNQKQKLVPQLYTEIMEQTPALASQQFRRRVSQLYNTEFINKKHSLAATYEAVLQRAKENAQVRGFKSVLVAALADDEVPITIYNNLIQQAKSHAHIVRNYFNLHKKYVGLKRYWSSDSRVRLSRCQQVKYDVETAQSIIRQSLLPLGAEYGQQLTEAWSVGRVDYFPAVNKQKGAYSTGGGTVKPIILLNWDASLRSVSTLAHETGHSVHTLLASAQQPYPLYEYPILLAEIASTLNEQLLFDELLRRTTSVSEKVVLLQQRVEDIIATFFRQVMLADFEQQSHHLVAQNQPLTAVLLAKLFQRISKAYGYDVFDTPNDDGKFAWTRVSHLFQSPFYVYKYATSIAAALFFYQQIQQQGSTQFIQFLKAGGSKPPLAILAQHNVKLDDPQLYQALFKQLTQLTQQLEIYLEQLAGRPNHKTNHACAQE